MQGTVVQLKARGVIASLDGSPEVGDIFQIYRIQNGVETILATGYLRKPRGNDYKINPIDHEDGSRGENFVGVQLGDLVRKVST
jgi:hypothetical protein